ncbi:MAG TPA: peptidylprolyl isomerase [Bdellovibrionales bacterium]|nr:peptidylprolyl isomerase [Bdellovibrionales bacterium]
MKQQLLSTVAVLLLTPVSHARVVDKIVAIVDDKPITLSDVNSFKKRVQTGGLVDDALLRLTDAKTLTADRNTLLNHLTDERIIDTEVKRKGMEVTIERVEQEIRTIAKGNGISRNQLRDALQAKGVTMSEYQDFIKTSLERQSLIEREVTSKIKISDEDISSYYLAKKGPSGSQIFEFTLAHILIQPKNGGMEAAMGRARAVQEKLKAGGAQNFDKLAEQYSEDANFSKGGQLGTFRAGEMVREIEDAVRKVGPGEITGIVKTSQGLHLIKVVKRTLIADPRLEEEREAIRNTLYTEAFKRQLRMWLDQRRDEAFIRINGFA